MDTSSKYIEMCQKSLEIQEQKPPGTYSRAYFYCMDHNCLLDYNSELEYQWCGNWDNWHGAECDSVVWLPQQDQLQAMIDSSELITQFRVNQSLWGTLFEYDMFTMEERYHRSKMYSTMEQLWLAFIMHSKYNKLWNGTKWIGE